MPTYLVVAAAVEACELLATGGGSGEAGRQAQDSVNELTTQIDGDMAKPGAG